MKNPIIIIGTGLAGYQLAKEFRKLNTDAPLMLITADQGHFYSKPQLSTAQTMGKTAESMANFTAEAMASQLNAIIKINTAVTKIDPKNKVIFVNEEQYPYEKLVFACGADVIKAPLEGDAVKDVFSINHIYHYAMFEEQIKNKKNITILGAGLIGCEFANDLSNAGFDVHVIAPAKTPLDLLLPEKIGKILQHALEQNNVKFHLGCVATHVNKIENKFRLQLNNGETLETEFVLSAIGLRPRVDLASDANIKIERGIVVNRFLETSEKEIYALGDCAEVEGHVLPYIAPLLNCSRALAKTLAGEHTAVDYPAMPVVVKTPAHPIIVCPPPKNILGEWRIETLENNSTRALFFDSQNKLYGFILTNDAVKERMNWVKQLPGLF
jgi:rubredoxin-NAD+ reductase